MFSDTEIKVLFNSDNSSIIKTEYVDVQPFLKNYSFEDGFDFEATKRVFCDKESIINENSYLLIENEKYKVMEIKTWDTYIEAFLYKCKRQV